MTLFLFWTVAASPEKNDNKYEDIYATKKT